MLRFPVASGLPLFLLISCSTQSPPPVPQAEAPFAAIQQDALPVTGQGGDYDP